MGMFSGAALLGASGLRALGAARRGRHRLHGARSNYARRQADFQQQLAAVLQWARAAKPVFKAWSGARPFRVAAVVDEAAECKSFYLTPEDGRLLPRFEPGQYLTFHLPIDPGQRPLVRCYSLSERPREDYYRITVKHVGPPSGRADLPAGQGSSYFHRHVQVGTVLDVQAPQGAFFLDPTDPAPMVLIGGGIGVTPLVSMVNAIAHQRRGQTVYVFAGFGNSREQPFREHLRELAAAHDQLHLDISYSRPRPADHRGREYDQRGRIDIARLRQVLPSNNFRFYLCGPPGMMQSLVPALWEWGVPRSQVHFEAFGPASVQGLSDASRLAVEPCQVEFSLAGTTLRWDGEQASLLELAEAAGVALDYGCRAGNCGECLVTVREGQVVHLHEPGAAVPAGQCLPCIGVPRGDVVLEA